MLRPFAVRNGWTRVRGQFQTAYDGPMYRFTQATAAARSQQDWRLNRTETE